MPNSNERSGAVDAMRRRWLQYLLCGPGLLGLRSVASGLPPWVLSDPTRLLALDDEAVQRNLDGSKAQFLVMAGSDSGEPINCNAPGTYDDPAILHPSDPSMAATPFNLGSVTTQAAAVWSTLPEAARARSCFFHHSTNSIGHGDFTNVSTLHGAVPHQENIFAAMAKLLKDPLGAIQMQPIAIGVGDGAVGLTVDGVAQPGFTPTTIKAFLSAPQALGPLNSLSTLRDKTLDGIYARISGSKTAAQRTLFDSWANSQAQARQLSSGVLGQLGAINDNSAMSQMVCAALLCSLKLAPTIMLLLPFGGDNHADLDSDLGKGKLPREQGNHVAALAAINAFLSTLASVGISDKVTFATLSTFGRTNAFGNFHGRTHNSGHTVSYMVGSNVRGSVVGGVTLNGIQLLAKGIDSKSGLASNGGDIAPNDSLNAYAATLAGACGIDDADISASVSPGQKVLGALVA